MQLIKTQQHNDGSVLFNLPNGKYAGLYVRMSGTNQAGQTFGSVYTDFGTLKINHFNTDIISLSPDHLIALTNLYGGIPENSTVAGAAYTHSFIIPFRRKNDRNNSLNVVAESTKFILTGFVTTTKVAAGTIEIYAIPTKAPSVYVPLLKGVDTTVGSAITDAWVKSPDANVAQFYVLTDANLSRAQVKVDGETVIQGSWGAIDAFSDATNLVETGITLVEVFAPKSDSLSESVNKEFLFYYTTTGAISPMRAFYFALALSR